MGVVYLAEDGAGQAHGGQGAAPGGSRRGKRAAQARPRGRDRRRRVRNQHVAEVVDADVASDPPYIVTRFGHAGDPRRDRA